MSQQSPLRAVGYCRTSSERQRDNTSIPNQKAAIEAFAKSQGWTLAKHYVDESKSGAKIEGRENFQQMMRDAANGLFDTVVVFDITRFARDGSDIIERAGYLKKDFGIHVIDSKGQFDNRNSSNVLLNFVHAGVSELERLKILERTAAGRTKQARDGLPWSANPPVGRAYDKKVKRWIVSEQGKVIAEIIRRYVKGESLTDLCREFKVPRRAKVSQWVWHGQLSGTYIAKFAKTEVCPEIEIPVPSIPEVIPQSLLEKAQKKLRHNRTHNRVDVQKYLLSGFIRCEHCKRALTGQSRHGHIYYRHNRAGECPFRSLSGDEIEPAVLDFLFENFLDEPAFESAINRLLPPPDRREELVSQRTKAEKLLAKNEREVRRLVDAIARGADISLLLSKQDELKQSKLALEERLQKLDEEIGSLVDAKLGKAAAAVARIHLIESLKSRDWRNMPYEDVQRFLYALFGETTVGGDTGIFVRRNAKGRIVATFRGRVEFHHAIAESRAVANLLEAAAKAESENLREVFKRALRDAEKEDEPKGEGELVKPFPVSSSTGAAQPQEVVSMNQTESRSDRSALGRAVHVRSSRSSTRNRPSRRHHAIESPSRKPSAM